MKTYLPRGSCLTETDVSAWKKETAAITNRFHLLFRNSRFHETNVEAVVKSFLTKEFVSLCEDCKPFMTEMWSEHVATIHNLILSCSDEILENDIVRYAVYLTACGEFFKSEIPFLESNFNSLELKRLLLENPVCSPTIVDDTYWTSESRVHHLTHLTYASRQLSFDLGTLNSFIEFGGGYGGMTELLRRINTNCTVVVIDLPVMLLLQAIYLSKCGLSNDLHFVQNRKSGIKTGAVNLVPLSLAPEVVPPSLGLFIATWSLSEANKNTHDLIVEKCRFFHAKYILYGYRKYLQQNPRQPLSRAPSLSECHRVVEDKCSFWTLADDNNYFLAKIQ